MVFEDSQIAVILETRRLQLAFAGLEVQNSFCEKRFCLALDMAAVSGGFDWVRRADDRTEGCSDRRSIVRARNKRDLTAATEIPAAPAISLTEPSSDCWISMMVRRAGRKRWIARFKSFSASFLA